MTITSAPDVNAAYIAVGDIAPGEVAQSVPINDDLILDIAADGAVLGLEILNASTFFSDLHRSFGGRLELPERLDPKTFDPTRLMTQV